MPLIPSLRRALARLFDRPVAQPASSTPSSSPPHRSPPPTRHDAPWRLVTVGQHVVFASSTRELERALVLLLEGATGDLRKACTRELAAVRGELESAAA